MIYCNWWRRCSSTDVVCRGELMRHTYKLLVENNTRKIARELKQGTSSYVDQKFPRIDYVQKLLYFPKVREGLTWRCKSCLLPSSHVVNARNIYKLCLSTWPNIYSLTTPESKGCSRFCSDQSCVLSLDTWAGKVFINRGAGGFPGNGCACVSFPVTSGKTHPHLIT